jgi:peptidoglycan/LPS O-acetylase OafA/YrhL
VDLFFVLSGFLIATILLKERGSQNYYSNFYLRRVCRIVPLYLLVLSVIVFVLPNVRFLTSDENLAWDGAKPWWFFLYIQNYGMGMIGAYRPKIFAPSWSLGVEEQFYAVLPAAVRALSARSLALAAAAAWTFSILLRLAIVYTGVVPSLAAEVWSICRVDALASGVLVALWWRKGIRVPRIVLPCALALLAFCLLVPHLGSDLADCFRPLPTALGYAGVLLSCLAFPSAWLPSVLSKPVLRWAGTISYGVYLLHAPIRCVLLASARELGAHGLHVPGFAITPAALILTFAIAHLSWTYFESPIVRWSHRRRSRHTGRIPGGIGIEPGVS